jgi:hypothetical protein
MAQHRMNCRRSGVRPAPDSPGPAEPFTARGVSVEEGLAPDVDVLPQPAGFGEEASTSQQSFQEIAQYTVPAKSLSRLREASLSIESNGEAKVTVSGTTYGPYTGATDVSVPLDPAVLTEGHQVRVFHQSTDGNSTTTLAQLVTLEV